MEDSLVSIVATCRKLGLEKEAQSLRAKFNDKLPHLNSEIGYIEQFYDLFRGIANLDPDQVPTNTPSIEGLPLDTSNRPQRIIVGQIGFMLHALYKEGFMKHRISDLRRETRVAHLEFGVKLQDLIASIGIYYNSVDPEQDKVELNSEGQIGNNRLVTCSHAIDKLVNDLEIRIEKYANDTNLENFDNPSIAGLIDTLAEVREALAFIIRSVHKTSSLPVNQLESLSSAIKKVLDFVKSLDAVDSQLDISREPTLANVAYQAVKHTNKQSKERELPFDQYPSVLQHHANVSRTAAEAYADNARTLKKVLRSFKKSRLALAQYNQKTNEFINKLQQDHVGKLKKGFETTSYLRDSIRKFLPTQVFNGQKVTPELVLSLPDDFLQEMADAFVVQYNVDLDEVSRLLGEIFTPNPASSPKGLFSANFAEYAKILDPDADNSVAATVSEFANRWQSNVSMGSFIADPAYDIDYLANELVARLEDLAESPTAVIDDEAIVYQLFSLGTSGDLSGSDSGRTKQAIRTLLEALGLDPSTAPNVLGYIEDFRVILRKLTQQSSLDEDDAIQIKELYADLRTYISFISERTRAREKKKGASLLLTGPTRSSSLTIEAIISRISTIDPQELVAGPNGYFVTNRPITSGLVVKAAAAAAAEPYFWEFQQTVDKPNIGTYTSRKKWTFTVLENGSIQLQKATYNQDNVALALGKPVVFPAAEDPSDVIDAVIETAKKELSGSKSNANLSLLESGLAKWYVAQPNYKTSSESDEVEFDTEQQREIIHNKGPSDQLEKVRKLVSPADSKRREPTSPDTIRENALHFSPKVPPLQTKNTSKFITTMTTELGMGLKYKDQLETQVKDSFMLLKETVGLIKISFDSARTEDNIDTTFRVFLGLYTDIQVPKAPWIDWKNKFNYITKMMSQSLIDIEQAADNASRNVQFTRFHGSTIDRVYSKFEDLVHFVGLYE